MECEDIGALPQHAVDQVLQYRHSAIIAPALAMDDAHAAIFVGMGLGDEGPEHRFGLRHGGAVQVEFVLRGKAPALQSLEHGHGQRVAPVTQGVARRQRGQVVQPALELAARLDFVAFGHARRRPGSSRAISTAKKP